MDRRQHIHLPDFSESSPLDILSLPALHPPSEVPHQKNMQQHAGMIIIVAVAQKPGNSGNDNPELFPQFTNQRPFRRFTHFDFSTRKFPLPGTGATGQTLLDQQFTGAILYNANSDMDTVRIGSRH